MKCPVCELEIENEPEQVRHMGRCHPDYLQKRLEDEGLSKMEIATQFLQLFNNLHPLGEILSQVFSLSEWVKIAELPDHTYSVEMKSRDGFMIESLGTTLCSTLCLAIDRLRYGT
jgi:hypothetical protein